MLDYLKTLTLDIGKICGTHPKLFNVYFAKVCVELIMSIYRKYPIKHMPHFLEKGVGGLIDQDKCFSNGPSLW